mmetsp:Transcript_54724/g.65841  ORF Transcript_54724/g.65841 Transcript_54724/m.65841 type:complete len:179 (-) Transcript_54724:523-1059(-)
MQTEESLGSDDRGRVEINSRILERHTLKKDVDFFQCKPDSILLRMQTSESFDSDDEGHHVDKEGEDDREEKDEKKDESSSVTKVKVISKLTSLGLEDFENEDDEDEKEPNQATLSKLSSNYAVVSHSDEIIPDDLYMSDGSDDSFDEIVTNDDVRICDENGLFGKTEVILSGSVNTVL